MTATQVEFKWDYIYNRLASCDFAQIYIAMNFIKEEKVTKFIWRKFVEEHINSLGTQCGYTNLELRYPDMSNEID